MKRKPLRWLIAVLVVAAGVITVVTFILKLNHFFQVEHAILTSNLTAADTNTAMHQAYTKDEPGLFYWMSGWILIGAGLFSLFPRPLMGAIVGAVVFALLSYVIPFVWYLCHWVPLL